MMIGIISDTPSLLRPEASARLAGVDHIIHAGDIGRPEVIAGLRALAPTTAIRGNIDTGRWAKGYGNNSTALTVLYFSMSLSKIRREWPTLRPPRPFVSCKEP